MKSKDTTFLGLQKNPPHFTVPDAEGWALEMDANLDKIDAAIMNLNDGLPAPSIWQIFTPTIHLASLQMDVVLT